MVPAAAPRLSAAAKEKVVEEKGRRGVRTTRAATGAKAASGEAPKGRVPAGRTRAAKTAVAVAAPVTPKRRRGAFGSLGRECAFTDGIGYVALDPVSLNTAVISPARNSLSAAVVQGKMEFDDFAKLVDLIRKSFSEVLARECLNFANTGVVSHLVGLVGHVLARVQLLNAARRLTERHTGVASEGMLLPTALQ